MTIASIQNIIRNLRTDGIAILITDHQYRETLQITDRSYLIANGQGALPRHPGGSIEQPEGPRVSLAKTRTSATRGRPRRRAWASPAG